MTQQPIDRWYGMWPRLKDRPVPAVLDNPERREWTWEHTSWGHEGVCIEHDRRRILWYSHRNNPHAGGGAGWVSYAEFLAQGASYLMHTPAEVVEELYDMVRFLAK